MSGFAARIVTDPRGKKRVVSRQTAWWIEQTLPHKFYCVHNVRLERSCGECRDETEKVA